MASLTTRVRNTAARADAARGIILESAEECPAYCTHINKPNASWDPNTGACRCW